MHFSVSRTACASLAGVLLGALVIAPLGAQQKQDERAQKQQQERLQRARSQEMQPLVQLVNGVMTGAATTPAPSEFPVIWQNDFLKATDQKTYVPFTLTIPASALTSKELAMYLRVVPKGSTALATPAQKPDAKNAPPAVAYAFEDVHFVELKAADATGNYRFSRAMAVPAGEYDAYVALRERNKKEGAKTTLVKQTVSVPDFWDNQLTTSSMILTDRMDPLQAPLSQQQQVERPYALGSVEIVPALDIKFGKSEVLNLFFLVYNPQLGPDNKPSLQLDYNFHQKVGTAEKYFNKTSPQMFDATTLPPQFDFAAGHQLVAGQSVPLTSFPEGEFRLEVKITDKLSGKSIVRNVNFTVGA
jgi:hypothetical protein